MRRSGYLRYLVRRIGIFLFTIWGAFTVAFVFFRLVPGDPISALMIDMQQRGIYTADASEDYVEAYREKFGLNGTLLEQYVRYIGNALLRFDLGPSIVAFPTPAQELIGNALPWTIGLLGLSTLIAWTLGVIAGGLVGWWRDFLPSQVLTTISIVLSQVPQYILAVLLLAVFAFTLAWFPTRNAYPASAKPGLTPEFIGGVIRHGALPALSIILVSVAGWVLSTRSLVVTILGEDYLIYAEAKGLPRRQIFLRYTLRNALLPQVTGLAISLGFIVNGAVLVETLFNYPGIGALLTRAVALLDYNTVQAVILISIITVLTANLLLDLALPLIDPRVRTGE